MKLKSILLDEMAVERAITRIAHEIVERNKGIDNLCLIGIVTRGVPFANKIKDSIKAFEGKELPVGKLDITLYRDDLTEIDEMPSLNGTDVPFDVHGKDVVLLDDVLFTGRTARAAIEATLKMGRPKSIQLAVLVDRGHRELPIRADYVGKNIPTSLEEVIAVKFNDTDNEQSVAIYTI